MNMQLYVTYGSPYARLARIIVIEKALEDRVEIIEAKTRTPGSPYYQINPSGRVPYLVDDASVGMEDSQLICAFLDGLDGKPALPQSIARIRLGVSSAGVRGAKHVRGYRRVGSGNGPTRERAFADYSRP
jgi:glutathione S-transferase